MAIRGRLPTMAFRPKVRSRTSFPAAAGPAKQLPGAAADNVEPATTGLDLGENGRFLGASGGDVSGNGKNRQA